MGSALDELLIRLDWSEEQLLADLGRSLNQREWLPRKLETLVDDGQRWMSEHYSEIQSRICALSIVEARSSDAPIILSAIADALTTLYDRPGMATVAVLLYKYGLDKLCD